MTQNARRIDTLDCVKTLEAAGIERKQAEAMTVVFANNTELQFQTSIKDTELRLTGEIKETETRLRGEIEKTRLEIELKIERSKNSVVIWMIGTMFAFSVIIMSAAKMFF